MCLKLTNVGKRYRNGMWGLRNLSLQLDSGLLGLLGPNGAGKTTLMNILATVTNPTEGTVHWHGQEVMQNPGHLRSVLGYLPQQFGVYPYLTAPEFLHYLAAVKGIDRHTSRRRVADLMSLVNLNDVAKRPLGTLSGGMIQRVGIAQALLNSPQLLIIDEPTVGLDPQERVQFRSLLSELATDRTIILSTHIVSDIESIAADIVILKRGAVLTLSSQDELLMAIHDKVWKCQIAPSKVNGFRKRYLVSNSAPKGNEIEVRVVSEERPRPDATQATPTLEDAYLYHISGTRKLLDPRS